MYTNFRWSKSLDNASDASPDKNSLTTGSVGGGQYSFGATAASDRSVSTFNIPYAWNLVAVYDLPFGSGQPWGANAWKPLRTAFGDWTVSGVERLTTGYPFTPTIAADNFIDTVHTHEIRPNIVSGVPLINPDWKRSCPTGAQCAPYVNYSAFELPPAGQLGDAPRTIAGITGPAIQTLDLSVQKKFPMGEKRRIELRVDALNALNHPIFRTAPNVGGGTDIFGNYPTFNWTAATLATVYNTWAAANPSTAFPATDPRGAAALTAFQNQILSQQNGSGTLPANFYTTPLPAHFSTTPAASFNILDPTSNGFKYYQIRNNINSGNGHRRRTSNQHPAEPAALPSVRHKDLFLMILPILFLAAVQFYSVSAPEEGNYRVTVTLGSLDKPAITTVKAELRRLMVEQVATRKGEITERTFIVNVRRPEFPGGQVKLKDREKQSEIAAWDDKITLEFSGDPAAPKIKVERVTNLPTVYIAGDSTSTDQGAEPYNSWGQMITRFFKPDIAVANHGESGESLKSFVGENRLAKLMSVIQPGDWLLISNGP